MQSAAPPIALKEGLGQICYNYNLYFISSNEKFDLEGLFKRQFPIDSWIFQKLSTKG